MNLFSDLKELIKKHEAEDSSRAFPYDFPAEWTGYPENEAEGRRRALDIIVNREPVPKWLDTRDFNAWFYAGPFRRERLNPNGWSYTVYYISGRTVMEAIIEARIKQSKESQ